MRKISLLLLPLLLLQTPAHAQMGGDDMGGMGGGGMGGGGMGGPGGGGPPGGGGGGGKPRMPKPISRAHYDKIVTALFRDADSNRDGLVTLDEFHTLVNARRDAAIKARFAKVDANGDGTISAAEFTAWQQQMGSVASDERGAVGDRSGQVLEVIAPDFGRDDDDRMLADLIEPISGTLIAKANTNYDAGVSLEELLAYEGARFEAADADKDGYLSMQELRPKNGGREGMLGRSGMRPMGPPPSGQ
ncbi:MAG: calcium-binding protein [Novosphingobium pentaromativorans]|uniref:Calcium-binding protein n=1 Tax=Novosphingobium pentaromativorans TaxID=205844 RepID=A0A2W5NU66_9SPHN|nr:EF-hand domain-containing protein [Novosphingobium panipatense]PZQ56996.1 MAG: calcium-binding protein [Novosphingobium pentaromativorans]